MEGDSGVWAEDDELEAFEVEALEVSFLVSEAEGGLPPLAILSHSSSDSTATTEMTAEDQCLSIFSIPLLRVTEEEGHEVHDP